MNTLWFHPRRFTYPSAKLREGTVISVFFLGLTVSAPICMTDAQLFFEARPSVPLGLCPAHALAPDFDGDGHLDIVVANHHSHDIWILLGDGALGFDPQPAVPVPGLKVAHDMSLAVADYDENGVLDAAVVSFSNDEATIFLGDGKGSLIDPRQFDVGDYPLRVVTADFDGDQHLDLASANRDGGTLSVLLGDGTGKFSDHVEYRVGDGPTALAVGDVSQDGALDLISADSFGSTVTILINDGTGFFAFGEQLDGFGITTGVLPRDLNGDGSTDLAVTHLDALSILMGVGANGFDPPVDYALGEAPFFVTDADLDQDGNDDLAVSNLQSHDVSLLRGDGQGGFSPAQNIAVGEGPWSVVVADWDEDGDPDLATTNEDANDLSLLANRTSEQEGFIRGDCNGDTTVGLPDALSLLNYVFVTQRTVPGCLAACDPDDDDSLGLSDALYILGFVFLGAEPPAAPYPECGLDPSPGLQSCLAAPTCP